MDIEDGTADDEHKTPDRGTGSSSVEGIGNNHVISPTAPLSINSIGLHGAGTPSSGAFLTNSGTDQPPRPQRVTSAAQLRPLHELRTQALGALMKSPQTRQSLLAQPSPPEPPTPPTAPTLPMPTPASEPDPLPPEPMPSCSSFTATPHPLASVSEDLLQRATTPQRVLPSQGSSDEKSNAVAPAAAPELRRKLSKRKASQKMLPARHIISFITKPSSSERHPLGMSLAGEGRQGSVKVHAIVAGSPAAEAGFQPGQRIWQINGTDIRSSADAASILQAAEGTIAIISIPPRKPGKLRVMIRKVINQRHEQRVAASLGVGDGVGEEPPPSKEPRTPTQTQVYRRPVTPPPERFEVVLERTSPKEELGLGIGLDDGHVFIYELHSVAAKNEKLRVNDRILAINGTPVSSDSDLTALLPPEMLVAKLSILRIYESVNTDPETASQAFFDDHASWETQSPSASTPPEIEIEPEPELPKAPQWYWLESSSSRNKDADGDGVADAWHPFKESNGLLEAALASRRHCLELADGSYVDLRQMRLVTNKEDPSAWKHVRRDPPPPLTGKELAAHQFVSLLSMVRTRRNMKEALDRRRLADPELDRVFNFQLPNLLKMLRSSRSVVTEQVLHMQSELVAVATALTRLNTVEDEVRAVASFAHTSALFALESLCRERAAAIMVEAERNRNPALRRKEKEAKKPMLGKMTTLSSFENLMPMSPMSPTKSKNSLVVKLNEGPPPLYPEDVAHDALICDVLAVMNNVLWIGARPPVEHKEENAPDRNENVAQPMFKLLPDGGARIAALFIDLLCHAQDDVGGSPRSTPARQAAIVGIYNLAQDSEGNEQLRELSSKKRQEKSPTLASVLNSLANDESLSRYASGCLRFLNGGAKLLLALHDSADDTLDSCKEFFSPDQARAQRQQLALEVMMNESEDIMQRAAARLQHHIRARRDAKLGAVMLERQAEAATLIANMFRGRAARKALDPALAKQAKSKRGAVAKKMAGTNIPEGADEITLLQGCFEEADGNGDGVVDFDEFCAVMETLSAQTGKRYSAMQLKAMFTKVDVDNSGTIEHSDFLNVRATHLLSLHEPCIVLLLPKDV